MQQASEVEGLKQKMWKKQYFLMFRTLVHPERISDVMLDHYRWIIDMEKQNRVFASGPMFEKDGQQGVGLTVIRADDWEEAERFAANDPFVTSGAVSFEIRRWQVNEGRVNVSIDFSDQTYSAS